jgi:diadenosine tetraphosphate (Ap4A) HIT family hydrolase
MPFELPRQDPCFFCEVIEGREEKGIVEETDQTLTFVNWRQFEVGQVYVIPRRHAPTLLDLAEDEGAAIFRAVRRVADALVRAYEPDGLTLYQNNGVASLQEVPHFHMHVVPRRNAASRWGSGPPHIAILEGRMPLKKHSDVRISMEQEHEVAAHIRRHMRQAG